MKNQNLVIICVVVAIILGSVGLYAYKSSTKPQPVEVAVISSSSKELSSSSVASSSQSSTSSLPTSPVSSTIPVSATPIQPQEQPATPKSQAVVSSKMVETKVSETKKQNIIDCPEYNGNTGYNMVKVNSNGNCFYIQLGEAIFKDDITNNPESAKDRLYRSEDNINLLKKLATDFYSKRKDIYIDKQPVVLLEGVMKEKDNVFKINIGMIDIDYFSSNSYKGCMRFCFRELVEYGIFKDGDSFSFKQLNTTLPLIK